MTIRSAAGRELRKGPRGGGRGPDQIVSHLAGAESGYLRSLGINYYPDENIGEQEKIYRLHEEVLKGLELSASSQIAQIGSRGEKRWPARFFPRQVTWHALDHAWEIKDRPEI